MVIITVALAVNVAGAVALVTLTHCSFLALFLLFFFARPLQFDLQFVILSPPPPPTRIPCCTLPCPAVTGSRWPLQLVQLGMRWMGSRHHRSQRSWPEP